MTSHAGRHNWLGRSSTRQGHTCSVSSELLSYNMEAFINIITTLETVITEDLDTLAMSTIDTSTQEIVDRIRINLSSHLTEARTLVIDKVRIRELAINEDNHMKTVNGHILTYIHGAVTNPQTVRAKGAYTVIWNCRHKLNIVKENILSYKTPHSSQLLALLALSTQMRELKIKKVHVISTSRIVEHTIEQLPLWHAQNFLTHDNHPMTNKTLLNMIHDNVTKNNLQFITHTEPVQGQMLEFSRDYSEVAKNLIREKMRAT